MESRSKYPGAVPRHYLSDNPTGWPFWDHGTAGTRRVLKRRAHRRMRRETKRALRRDEEIQVYRALVTRWHDIT
jgi:hypothetical protein